ncbi:MAG: EscU/YscU/HrcU family type III secretion system export apparatus switch protein [Bryobacteraceae bacterium]
MASKDQRTEQPSPRRLEKARKDGNLPISREFVAAAQFTAFVALVAGYGERWASGALALMRYFVEHAFARTGDGHALLAIPAALTWPVAVPLLMAGCGLSLAALAAHGLSTGFALTPSKLTVDWGRLDPSRRLAELPSRGMFQAAIATGLLAGLAIVFYWLAGSLWATLVVLPLSSLGQGLGQVSEAMKDLLWKAAGLIAIFGAYDFYHQRDKWNAGLRMTKQEVRDEAKQAEGDPQIKMRVRRLMRERSRRRMMQDVARATAVVVNPTHYAVAIRYVPAEMHAPRVVAKGKNYLAQRIRETALRNQIPIVENPPLAQALYKAAAVGQDIPAHLYRAVAEVLAYLYRLMGGRLPGG